MVILSGIITILCIRSYKINIAEMMRPEPLPATPQTIQTPIKDLDQGGSRLRLKFPSLSLPISSILIEHLDDNDHKEADDEEGGGMEGEEKEEEEDEEERGGEERQPDSPISLI